MRSSRCMEGTGRMRNARPLPFLTGLAVSQGETSVTDLDQPVEAMGQANVDLWSVARFCVPCAMPWSQAKALKRSTRFDTLEGVSQSPELSPRMRIAQARLGLNRTRADLQCSFNVAAISKAQANHFTKDLARGPGKFSAQARDCQRMTSLLTCLSSGQLLQRSLVMSGVNASTQFLNLKFQLSRVHTERPALFNEYGLSPKSFDRRQRPKVKRYNGKGLESSNISHWPRLAFRGELTQARLSQSAQWRCFKALQPKMHLNCNRPPGNKRKHPDSPRCASAHRESWADVIDVGFGRSAADPLLHRHMCLPWISLFRVETVLTMSRPLLDFMQPYKRDSSAIIPFLASRDLCPLKSPFACYSALGRSGPWLGRSGCHSDVPGGSEVELLLLGGRGTTVLTTHRAGASASAGAGNISGGGLVDGVRGQEMEGKGTRIGGRKAAVPREKARDFMRHSQRHVIPSIDMCQVDFKRDASSIQFISTAKRVSAAQDAGGKAQKRAQRRPTVTHLNFSRDMKINHWREPSESTWTAGLGDAVVVVLVALQTPQASQGMMEPERRTVCNCQRLHGPCDAMCGAVLPREVDALEEDQEVEAMKRV
ncbi:uncharacterized protein MYCFIDRAFT_173315 [Pseudocercospora fijiensis CIRAD86]|uniref:Uncharacterized protein n=1 Tax=Pseudocercospora fijiensis (strain CIRAD86) TaxID=383855 RepID=M3B4J7_PSEFD|nr:uncharacterized protein MYCFIDRAFT_173315 [Pseudocercospora fijiensis CIRAD86]EME84298.1 hypothetical protein MYCFIDRAFT_173315 [Pseudocercospora fijiensis CIRAD86]